jgi:hypothetical protein
MEFLNMINKWYDDHQVIKKCEHKESSNSLTFSNVFSRHLKGAFSIFPYDNDWIQSRRASFLFNFIVDYCYSISY